MAVAAPSTGHRLITCVSAPASTSARRSPYTPSPAFASPTPVWQAESTASFVPYRSSPAASKAVRMPSSCPLAQALAPARAMPGLEQRIGEGGAVVWVEQAMGSKKP